jgi:hypothetical protein
MNTTPAAAANDNAPATTVHTMQSTDGRIPSSMLGALLRNTARAITDTGRRDDTADGLRCSLLSLLLLLPESPAEDLRAVLRADGEPVCLTSAAMHCAAMARDQLGAVVTSDATDATDARHHEGAALWCERATAFARIAAMVNASAPSGAPVRVSEEEGARTLGEEDLRGRVLRGMLGALTSDDRTRAVIAAAGVLGAIGAAVRDGYPTDAGVAAVAESAAAAMVLPELSPVLDALFAVMIGETCTMLVRAPRRALPMLSPAEVLAASAALARAAGLAR